MLIYVLIGPVTFVLEGNDRSIEDERNIPRENVEPIPPASHQPNLGLPSAITYQAQTLSLLDENRSTQISTNETLNRPSDGLSLRGASLMRYFIQRLAPWVRCWRAPYQRHSTDHYRLTSAMSIHILELKFRDGPWEIAWC
jgi:hypothetical protein